MDEKKNYADVENFINFIKTSFYATLDNIYEIQELSEKVLKEMAKTGKDLQSETEDVLNEFIVNAKMARDDFKLIMENGFRDIEEAFKVKDK